MSDAQYSIERTRHDHADDHQANEVGPLNLLQEVHDDRMDRQVTHRRGDRVETMQNCSDDQLRVVGAVPVFDSKDQTIVIDHAWNQHIPSQQRDIVVQHHDVDRREDKHDVVLFGLFSGEHHERNIQHDLLNDGQFSRYSENTTDDSVKFLGITIFHNHDDSNAPKPHYVPRPQHRGKGCW